MYLVMERKRLSKGITIDSEVWNAIAKVAQDQKMPASRWIENILFDVLKSSGAIAPDVEKLGERRGGSRQGSGRKVSNPEKS